MRRIKNLYHLYRAFLANLRFGWPSRKLRVIGVTGTDGKTTTSTLIYHVLNFSGQKTALITTVGAKIFDKDIDTGLHTTTPDSEKLQSLVRRAVDKNAEFLVLETTSHGLDQHRLFGIHFTVGVITNVTHEHFDYHGNYENYLKAKSKLFGNPEYAVLNKDDQSFNFLYGVAKHGRAKIVTYGLDDNADFNPKNWPFKTKLLGRHNKYNCLAAIAVCSCLGIPEEKIRQAIGTFDGVEGRLEEINAGQNFKVYVDFAHTPNAIKCTLEALREKKKGRLIAVFGSAGIRDKTKRPIMGKNASELADIVILTTDDPRTENVSDIIDQIAMGCVKAGAKEGINLFRIPDRRKAIEAAVGMAKPGDVIALCGKGHERSLAVGTKEIPWNEREEARKAIKSRKKNLRIHFVGIGGSGASEVALLAKKNGFIVSGCDIAKETYYINELKKSGINPLVGHSIAHLKDVDVVTVSPALLVKGVKNSEVEYARERSILMTWQEFMGKILQKGKYAIGICGTHGKTTTTAMMGLVMEEAGLDPTVEVGGIVPSWGSGARFGKSKYFVFEADEYNYNFLNYSPSVIILNNIEMDHPEFYKNYDAFKDSFRQFIERIKGPKLLVANEESKGVQEVLVNMDRQLKANKINVFGYYFDARFSYSYFDELHCSITGISPSGTDFSVINGNLRKNYRLGIVGRHNVANSLGVIAVADFLKIPHGAIDRTLRAFKNLGRRFELVGEKKQIMVFDDYAVHPSAVEATIAAARQKYPGAKIIAVFEPHQFSRLKIFKDKFAIAFGNADFTYGVPVFAGREIDNGSTKIEDLMDLLGKKGATCNSFEDCADKVSKAVSGGEVIIVFGAGKSYLLSRLILEKLGNE